MSEPSFSGFADIASTSSTGSGDDEAAKAAANGGPPTGGGPNTPPPPLGGGDALPHKRRWSLETGFRSLTTGAGMTVLVIIVAIGAFLIDKAVPALQANHANFLTYKNWFPSDNPPMFGIAALAFGTVLTSILALIMAVPVALSIALCLTHYAPRRVASVVGFAIDLLAAVPSIVYGLWGRDYLVKPISGLSAWLHAVLRMDPDLRQRRTVRQIDPARFDRLGDHGSADRDRPRA